jgi:hypothetical protein
VSRHLLAALPIVFAASTAEAQADFALTWASQPSSVLSVGDVVSVSFDVENNGLSAASFTVGFVIDDGTNAYLLHEEPVPTLASGGFTSGSMTFVVPSGADGLWYAGLVADPFDAVVETNETDNVFVFTSQITIGGGGMTGTISVISETLPNANPGSSYSAMLRQTGGTAPSWYISSGSLPSGLSLSTNGLVSGTTTQVGTFSFTANAEQSGFTSGSGSFTLTVAQGSSGITVGPSVLPEAHVGAPYEAHLTASGGTPPYGYQVIGAPSWLMTIGAGAEAGTLRGTPDATGHLDLTVYVIDTAGSDATVTVSLDITESGPITVHTSMPGGVTGKPYEGTVVSGGIPPYTVQITNGSLPSGLVLDGGDLTGVPSAPGTYSFTVEAADAMGATASGAIDLVVGEFVGLAIASTTIVVFVNADVSAPLEAKGGVPPYAWQMVSGALPAGVSFDPSAGTLIGKPDKVGEGSGTFVVTDAEGATAQGDIEVQIRVFRAPGGRGGGRGSRGCACVVPSSLDLGSLFAVAALMVLGRKRRASA